MNKASPHKKEHTGIIVHIILALYGISAVFMVLKGTALYGPGISSDALNYISTARHLVQGKGYYSFDEKPYTHWPPLYPSLIALLNLAGLEPLDAARTINAVSFALVVICSGAVFAKRIKSPLLILLGSAAVLISATMLRVSVYAWTEPLFALLVILFMLTMTKFLKDGRLKFLLLAAVCAALAALQRYVGIAVIMAGAAMIFLLSHKTGWLNKLKYSAVFGTISCVPLGLWLLRNKLVASTAADYSLWLDTTFLKEITETLDSLTPWFVTSKFSLAVRLLIIGVLIILMAAAVILRNRVRPREAKTGDTLLVKASIILIAVYAAFATIASVYAKADADYRIYSSVYVFIILLFLTGLDAVAKLSGAVLKRDWRGYLVVTILCGLWLVFYPLPLVRQQMAYYTANGVPGYSSILWRQSPLLNWVRMHPLDGQVFSNEPYPLVLLAGVSADITPARRAGLEDFKNQLSANNKNYLVWYYNHWRTHLYNLEELNSQFKLKPIAKLPDGAVFEIQ